MNKLWTFGDSYFLAASHEFEIYEFEWLRIVSNTLKDHEHHAKGLDGTALSYTYSAFYDHRLEYQNNDIFIIGLTSYRRKWFWQNKPRITSFFSNAVDLEPEQRNALKQYEDIRLEATSNVVRMNRINPPDAILREVWERSEDKPFEKIEDVISVEEMEIGRAHV